MFNLPSYIIFENEVVATCKNLQPTNNSKDVVNPSSARVYSGISLLSIISDQ